MASNTIFFKLNFSDNRELLQPSTAKIQAKFDGTYKSITPEMTKSQFSDYIQTLIQELEKIKKNGERKFAAS